MKKYLSAYGNTWQFYISKPIAQLLGLTQEEYTVNLSIENKILYVKKVPNAELDKYKDLLCKKLIKRNSSFGLTIPVAILEVLGVNPEEDKIEFDINGQTLIITKEKQD